MQEPTGAGLIAQLLPMIILSLPLVIGVFWLAPKMRSNPWIWAVLFLIPGSIWSRCRSSCSGLPAGSSTA